ncbi:Alpha/beta hydrolase fold-1 domain-containing protein [Penicillium ucsense]|uniref:Alpha/beta hydrolase fold-1 domain-containing protein n=1 Tax=Penicillium ucsense TaxID=2839758 RepID=A0A8J8W2X9_9EURO|nr:Alpha/beta hydrolase fold-1 domain-containing protein [Penicillium ucsense]KAF7734439.1 Alpha/beta hydrolase fold-1 domain-containing protein [Penicillium ucsense]
MALYHQTVDFLSESWANQRTQLPLLAVTGASFTLGLLLRSLFKGDTHKEAILASPRTRVLPHISEEEKRKLPLPDDVLPGGRDVATPYGSIRVYEWGREDGPKVLLVHGITTPCIALGGVAHALVDRGCRVMLFDLFGRGYSDCPSDMPQDERLFATQIMLALTTSLISWTGSSSGKFSLVGYSLGGGIAAAFASFFPQLLSSLVLLAPAGLVRDSQISFQGRVLYSGGIMPEGLLAFLVSRRLKSGRLVAPKKDKQGKLNAEDALTEELPSDEAAEDQVLSREYPRVTVPSAVAWQVHNHAGFVHSFMSSMRYGPILGSRQKVHWTRLGDYLSAQNSTGGEKTEKGLPSHKVHILCGNTDTIIIKDELVSDATAVLGGNVVFKFYDAGHEFPSTKYEEVATYIEKVLQ